MPPYDGSSFRPNGEKDRRAYVTTRKPVPAQDPFNQEADITDSYEPLFDISEPFVPCTFLPHEEERRDDLNHSRNHTEAAVHDHHGQPDPQRGAGFMSKVNALRASRQELRYQKPPKEESALSPHPFEDKNSLLFEPVTLEHTASRSLFRRASDRVFHSWRNHSSARSGSRAGSKNGPPSSFLARSALGSGYSRLTGTGALGDGMNEIVRHKSVHNHHQVGIDITNLVPNIDLATRNAGQQQADLTGKVIAVSADTPLMDVSTLDLTFSPNGSKEFSFHENGTTATDAQKPSADLNTSYFFPEDPDKPNWKPISLKPPYLITLVVLAIGLASLQEYFCQRSIRFEKEGKGILTFQAVAEVSLLEFFLWKYAPTLVLVTYGILCHISTFEINRLEPFYQLSRKGGARADRSLNLTYVTDISLIIPFLAMRYRHWAVFFGNLGLIIAAIIVPVVQSASMYVFPPPDDRQSNSVKSVRIKPAWSRLTTVLLVFVAAIYSVLIFIMRRKSGLLSDPKGIAGIAAMATRSHILQDFNGLDTMPNTIIHERLRRRRYVLHKSSLWQGELRPTNAKEEIKNSRDDRTYLFVLNARTGYSFLASLGVVFCFLPVVALVYKVNMVFSKNAWLLVAISNCVKTVWSTLDSELRTLEPFYVLYRRHAPPKTLTVDYTGTIPGYLVVKAIANGHYLVAAVGFGTILAEVLTVCAPALTSATLNFDPAHEDDAAKGEDTVESFRSYWASAAITYAGLVYMFFTLVVVLRDRRTQFLPRRPGSIASVLAYIHSSRMLNPDFIGTEKLNARQMTRHLDRVGKTYGIGWFRNMGEDRMGIDEEELDASYEHGARWKDCRLNGAWVDTTQL